MQPGIYRNMSVADYDAIPAVRRTFLWHLFKHSPGQAKYREQNFKPTKALTDGTMVHTALLEPEEFPNRYAVMPSYELERDNVTKGGGVPKSLKSTGYYKGKKANFERICADGGTELVAREDYDMALMFGKNIRKDEEAGRFFRRGTSSEAVVIAELHGVLCKARFDSLAEGEMPTCADIKTAADAHADAFKRSVSKFGYYFQESMYLSLLRAAGLKSPNFLFIVCDKTPPWEIAVRDLGPRTRQLGALHVKRAIDTYKQCVSSGKWPFFAGGIEEIDLSDFDLKELEKDHD